MKTAVVTGISRRFGNQLTFKLLDAGWQVIGISRTDISASQIINDSFVSIICDYYNEDSINACINSIKAITSEVDLLVNNASLFEKDETHNNSFEFLDNLIRVHLKLPIALMEGLSEHLHAAESAAIINITDVYASNPNKEYSLYCATKAALDNVTISYAKKYAPRIRVNAIQPGPVKYLDSHTKEDVSTVSKQTLLQTGTGFESLISTVFFLIENKFITGSSIKVDGGRSVGGV